MRKALWAGFTLVSLAAPALGRLLVVLSGANIDREEDLFPDPREREGFRLQSLRNAAQGYAGAHDGRFPSDLQTLIAWIPAEERAAVAGWTVELWGTPVRYEPFGPASFSVVCRCRPGMAH